jgi:hypothetical protein
VECDVRPGFWLLVAAVTVALIAYKIIVRVLRVVGYALEEWRWRRARRRRNEPGIDVHDVPSMKDSHEE